MFEHRRIFDRQQDFLAQCLVLLICREQFSRHGTGKPLLATDGSHCLISISDIEMSPTSSTSNLHRPMQTEFPAHETSEPGANQVAGSARGTDPKESKVINRACSDTSNAIKAKLLKPFISQERAKRIDAERYATKALKEYRDNSTSSQAGQLKESFFQAFEKLEKLTPESTMGTSASQERDNPEYTSFMKSTEDLRAAYQLLKKE